MTFPRMWARALVCLAALTVCLAPAPAHGQDPPRLAVAFAAGAAQPLHSDLDFVAPEWQVSLRAQVLRHFGVEGFYGEWRKSSTLDFIDQPVFGPNGLIGRIGRVSEHDERVTRTFAFAGLATGTVGRVTIAGGGGPGLMTFERTSRTRYENCDPGLAFCDAEQRREFSTDSFSLHALARAEFLASSRVGLFGQFQTNTPIRDAGSTHVSVTGGVRFTLRR